MRTTWVIFKREFAAYFNSTIAYVFAVVFFLTVGGVYVLFMFREGKADMRLFFELLPWFFIWLVSGISMRLWAEEKKVGTQEVLLTLPVTSLQAVLGKYLGALAFMLLCLALTFPFPVALAVLGNPDWGPIIGGYLAAVLVVAMFLAIGAFFSSITQNQIVAFILTALVLVLLSLAGIPPVYSAIMALQRETGEFVRWLAVTYHFGNIARGILDSRDIVYALSLTVFFLYLNVAMVEGRR
jgi:ABC-2 type transport system permease protein